MTPLPWLSIVPSIRPCARRPTPRPTQPPTQPAYIVCRGGLGLVLPVTAIRPRVRAVVGVPPRPLDSWS